MPRGKSGPRMLSGLSLDNLVAEDPEESIEQEQDEATDQQPASRRSLRQSKSEAAPIYDMKYHPMDVVTRPNRAPTIRHRSKSVSFALDDDYNSDESSELSSAPSDEDDGSSGDEESEEEDVDTTHRRMIATPRTPDPRAVRHSARSEARKPINYSKKFHPQDYGLPGYKHRAQPQMQFVAHPQVHIFSSASPKKRKHLLPTPEDDGQIDLVGDYDEALAEEEEEREDRRPRKKLRTIDLNIASSPRVTKTKAKSAKQMPAIPDSDELEDLVDVAMIGSQPPSRRQLDTMSEDNIDEVDEVLDSIKQDHQKMVEQANSAKADQEMIEISSAKSDDTDEEDENEEIEDEQVEDGDVGDEASADKQPDLQDSTTDVGNPNDSVDLEQRPAESSGQNTQLSNDEENVVDHGQQPGDDGATEDQPADNSEQQNDHREDAANNSQQPADGAATDDQPAGASTSSQQPDAIHENDEEMGPEPAPLPFFHAMSQRFSGFFASNQQASRDIMAGQRLEENDEDEEVEQQLQPTAFEQHQSSEFEEQFAITKSSYITAGDEPNEDEADGSQPKLPNETGPNEIEPDEDEPDEEESNEVERNEEETIEDDLSRSDPLRLVPQSDDGKVPTSDSAASECRH
ncbi:hypothetical protein PRZ48_013946 [Zasmidium cellare]|uniref:Uncharacterized protein n=1 Tax=Zasmidium cellare TaxID=395010 RepID=A0ABR0E000_ZASCE|nr:hypothetical protein PRZ48_013946 [Zasmidium cellare]